MKSPRVVKSGNEVVVRAKITVTTDLGESFLAVDMRLAVRLVFADGKQALAGTGKDHLWKGVIGMRTLEVSTPVPSKARGLVRLLVQPAEDTYKVDAFGDVPWNNVKDRAAEYPGGVVAVRSMEVDLAGEAGAGLAERVFTSTGGDEKKEIHIWEETGESIARHIWYDTRSGQVRPPLSAY